MEIASSSDLYDSPRHPYTQALLSAVPVPDPGRKSGRIVLRGDVPSPANPPPGCPFHPRCPVAIPECSEEFPEARDFGSGHRAWCIRAE
jgi:peptide/nickel transport system ATP-binding protein